MNSHPILKAMDEAEGIAYFDYSSETKKTVKQKLYKAFKALQEANEIKRFLLLVK